MSDFPIRHTSKGDVPLLPQRPDQDQAHEPEPDFVLTLRPLRSDIPVDQRLKQLLKVALRRFKFRLLKMAELKAGGPDPAKGG